MDSNTIISIKNATVRRGPVTALRDLNLHIKEGEHSVILGPNGAGKSTLLKLITRELSPICSEDSHLHLFGKELVNIWDLRKKIGVVSHDYQQSYQSNACGLDVVCSAFFGSVGLFKHQNVSETQQASALATLNALGISSLADKPYTNLSTGQQRRLILARALVHKPRALIFDEPTNALDIPSRFWFIDTMRKLAQANTTLILVTHEPSDVIPEINNVIFLKNGMLFQKGSKQQLMTSECCSKLFDTGIEVTTASGYYQFLPAGKIRDNSECSQ